MSTIINATTTNGVVIQPDNSGSLVLQTNNGTTALTISTAQNATFAAQATIPTINLTGGQIKFPTTQSASADGNTLDDYEEGTWTPTVTFTTPGNLSVAYSYRIGQYQKVGGWVTVSFSLRSSTFTFTTASGDLTVSGLPFTSHTETDGEFNGAGAFRGITKANFTQISASVGSNVATIRFNASGSGQIYTSVEATDTPTAGTLILKFTCSYKTA